MDIFWIIIIQHIILVIIQNTILFKIVKNVAKKIHVLYVI